MRDVFCRPACVCVCICVYICAYTQNKETIFECVKSTTAPKYATDVSFYCFAVHWKWDWNFKGATQTSDTHTVRERHSQLIIDFSNLTEAAAAATKIMVFVVSHCVYANHAWILFEIGIHCGQRSPSFYMCACVYVCIVLFLCECNSFWDVYFSCVATYNC